MRIVEYLHTVDGGHPAYTMELAHGLRAAGADVTVLTGVGARAGEGVVAEVPTPDTTLRPATVSWLVDRIRVYVGQTRTPQRSLARFEDVEERWLHCQQLPTLFPRHFVRSAQRRGWKVCVTVHNVTPHAAGRLDALTQKGQEAAWAQADLLVVHADSLRDRLVERLGQEHASKVVVVAHPVWAEQAPSDAWPTRDYLFFGHLRPNKGVEEFLAAMARMPDATATVAGSGSPERIAQVQDEIARLGLANVTLRAEFVPDEALPALFADHHVVVAPYREFEAQSGVTHLAVAYDRPIVVTDVGALRDLVDQFGLGEVVERGDALPDVMGRTLRRARAGEFGDGLARARRQLSPKVIGEVLIGCMDSSMKDG